MIKYILGLLVNLFNPAVVLLCKIDNKSRVSKKAKIWRFCVIFNSSVDDYSYIGPKTRLIHVFVTRTFSKLFAMAGCRLGYVVGWPEGVKMVQKLCTPHNTNAFAMAFAEAIIDNPDVLNSLIMNFNDGRQYLIDQMDANGYKHKGEAGNFIFIKTKTDAEKIVARMGNYKSRE